MRHRDGILARVMLAVVASLVLGSLTSGTAQAALSALVPAYFAPGTGGPGGVGDGWAAMAADAGTIPITAIMNPSNGPGSTGQVDAYQDAVANLQAQGGQVIGYLATGYGTVPIATIEAEIGIYRMSNVNVNGFFLDQVNSPINLSYYQQLYTYIKALNPLYQVVGNPGTPYLNGVSPTDFLSVATQMVIFEGPNTGNPGDVGFNNYPYGLNWWTQGGFPSSNFANVVFATPTVADMQADVLKAYSLNAGSVYLTDADLPNPYNQLPSYWNEEVAALASVPEPSSLATAAASVLIGLTLMRLKRRGLAGGG